MLRRVAGVVLKLTVTLAIFAVVARDVDFNGLLQTMRGASPVFIGASFLVLLALSSVQAFRWHVILFALGARLSYQRLWSIVLMGIFFSQLLPTSIGGDAIRVWKLHRSGTPLAKSFNSVVLDRVSAIFAVVLIIALGISVLFELLQDPVMRTMVLLAPALTVCALLLLALIVRYPDLGRWFASLFGARMSRTLKGGVRDASAILLSPRPMLITLGLSVFMQMAISFSIWILAIGVGARIGFMECIVLVPFVILASMLPISVAGWGVREGAMVFAFGFAGVDSTTALTISILFGIVVAATGLPGGLLWLHERRHL